MDNNKDISLNVLFRTFQVKLFPPKKKILYFILNILLIYANIYNIYNFELNPLDNKKDINHKVLFMTFHSGQFSGHNP